MRRSAPACAISNGGSLSSRVFRSDNRASPRRDERQTASWPYLVSGSGLQARWIPRGETPQPFRFCIGMGLPYDLHTLQRPLVPTTGPRVQPVARLIMVELRGANLPRDSSREITQR